MHTQYVVEYLSEDMIESRANMLGSRYEPAWNGREPMPLRHIFEKDLLSELGFRAVYANLKHIGLGVLSYTDIKRRVCAISSELANDYSLNGRRIFRAILAHEIGHCSLHSDAVNMRPSTHTGKSFRLRALGGAPSKNPEWQAWRFALSLCMPKHLIDGYVRLLGCTNQSILAMSDIFDVSRTFVQMRLRSLEYLPN